MNKKGKVLGTIITLIILLIFLGVVMIYIIGPEGILPKAAEAGAWFADKELGRLKKEKFGKTIVESDKNVEESYESIINILRNEDKGPCILKGKNLANNFKGLKISLTENNGDTTINLINQDGQIIKSTKIGGKVPCAVGEGDSANNFENNYLKGKCESNCPKDYSSANIEIQSDNTIYINGQKRGFKGDLLFKARDGNICFFPTYAGWFTRFGCDSSKEGLDDDCIDKINEKIPECSKLIEWTKILLEHEKNKCVVNKYTCKIENLGCECFSSGIYQSRQKPDTCDDKRPYCYEGIYGCSDKGPDTSNYLEVCKQTIGSKFELAPKCEVDKNSCQIKNAPCSCYTEGSKKENKAYVCLEGQYCYNEQVGCRNEAPTAPLYADYCQKSNKN